MRMRRDLVAVVGRPNVGKSTLFNRLVGDRIAIVEDEPGTTRDRLYATVEWRGRGITPLGTRGPAAGPSGGGGGGARPGPGPPPKNNPPQLFGPAPSRMP